MPELDQYREMIRTICLLEPEDDDGLIDVFQDLLMDFKQRFAGMHIQERDRETVSQALYPSIT